MMFSNMKRLLLRGILVLAAGLALTACASRIPDSIRGDDTALVPYHQAINTDEQGVGQTARWGGLIAKVTNTETTSTIEVVQMELKGSGRPVVNEQSAGRFRIRVNGFIDPNVYTAGRAVTVYGTYTGKETAKIGEFVYNFPVIESQGVHLWRLVEDKQQVEVMMHYGIGSPYYSPFYRHPFYMPGTIRVRDRGNKPGSDVIQNRPRPTSTRDDLKSSNELMQQQ